MCRCFCRIFMCSSFISFLPLATTRGPSSFPFLCTTLPTRVKNRDYEMKFYQCTGNARDYLLLVPFRGHFGEVDLWSNARQPLHCCWYKPLVLGFLLPLPSKNPGILFLLCLPTSLLDKGGKTLKPSSTGCHWDLSGNGETTAEYACLNILTEKYS